MKFTVLDKAEIPASVLGGAWGDIAQAVKDLPEDKCLCVEIPPEMMTQSTDQGIRHACSLIGVRAKIKSDKKANRIYVSRKTLEGQNGHK